jgi:hypothetical protein
MAAYGKQLARADRQGAQRCRIELEPLHGERRKRLHRLRERRDGREQQQHDTLGETTHSSSGLLPE